MSFYAKVKVRKGAFSSSLCTSCFTEPCGVNSPVMKFFSAVLGDESRDIATDCLKNMHNNKLGRYRTSVHNGIQVDIGLFKTYHRPSNMNS